MNVPAPTAAEKVLLDAEALRRTLSRIAHEIIEANPDLTRVALVGIQTRGVPLAQRLRRLVEGPAGEAPVLGAVDITFYRDDVQVRGGDAPRHPQPVVRSTALDFPLEGKTVVLVDDVLYTGRPIRAATGPHAPRGDRGVFRLRPPRSHSARRPRRPRPPRAAHSARLRRQEPSDLS